MDKNIAVLNEPIPQEPASTIRKSNVSVTISLIALVLASVPIYFKFFEPIKLDFAISRDVYISNTWGGLPDLNLSIALRANGPETKALIVDSAKVTLTKLDAKDTKENLPYILTNSRQDKSFPLILKGGDVASHTIRFHVNDYIPKQIDRYNTWCKKLIELLPKGNAESINEICEELKEDFLLVGNNRSLQRDDIFKQVFLMAETVLEEKKSLNDKISELLRQQSVEVEELQKLLFFMSGNYEMQIELLDPFGTSLAVQKHEFSIEEVVSKTLRHRFNKNLRILTSQVDPA